MSKRTMFDERNFDEEAAEARAEMVDPRPSSEWDRYGDPDENWASEEPTDFGFDPCPDHDTRGQEPGCLGPESLAYINCMGQTCPD